MDVSTDYRINGVSISSAVQTFTNKTMTANSNNVNARALWTGSGTSAVSTYAAAAPTVGQVLVATSGTTATWQARRVFGDSWQSQVSEGSSSTTSTNFVNKVTMTTASLPSGTYRIGWYAEYNMNTTNNDFQARVRLNNASDLMFFQLESKDSGGDQYSSISGFDNQSLSGINEVTLDYSTNNSGSTATIRRSRLEIWRVA
jgi:Fe-S cluster assembly iron-binding protein IscA